MKREQDPRFRHLETIVGVFIVAGAAALLAALVYIGIANDLFTKKYHLRFIVERGTGFVQGMPVKLSGFRIGRVAETALTDKAEVEVRLQINRRYQKWIRANSVATLTKEGLVGDSVVDISVGSPDNAVLKDNDTIEFRREPELAELAQELSESVKSVLGEVRATVAYINDPEGDIKKTLGNLRNFSAGLEVTRTRADALLETTTDNVKAIGNSAVSLLNNASGRVDNIAAGATTVLSDADAKVRSLTPAIDNLTSALAGVQRRLPPLLDRAEGTLSNAEKISAELRKAAEKAAPRIPPLIGGAEALVDDAGIVVRSLKSTWPFKNHIPPDGKNRIVPGDSHE